MGGALPKKSQSGLEAQSAAPGFADESPPVLLVIETKIVPEDRLETQTMTNVGGLRHEGIMNKCSYFVKR